MILIQRYIFKELLYNFVFTFVVITMIMLLAMSVKVIFKFPALGFLMLMKNIPIMLAASLTIVIPASVLVATVMFLATMAFAPEYGVIAKAVRRRRIRGHILAEDVLKSRGREIPWWARLLSFFAALLFLWGDAALGLADPAAAGRICSDPREKG